MITYKGLESSFASQDQKTEGQRKKKKNRFYIYFVLFSDLRDQGSDHLSDDRRSKMLQLEFFEAGFSMMCIGELEKAFWRV